MDKTLRILLVDDSSNDRAQGIRKLNKQFVTQVVEVSDADGFDNALESGSFDIVITDSHFGWTTGLEVLKKTKARHPDCPVIMFTDTGSEEIAVEAMKNGLDDYILKSAKPIRLNAAVRGVMLKTQEIYEHKQMEEALQNKDTLYREIFESALDIIELLDKDGNIVDINRRGEQLLGYAQSDLRRMNVFQHLVVPEDQHIIRQLIKNAFEGRNSLYEVRYRTKEGKIIHFDGVTVPRMSGKGEFLTTFCTLRDITERKRAEEELRSYRDTLRSLALEISIVEERERHRIATDLHDHIGQTLAIANIKLGALREDANTADVIGTVDEIRSLIDQAIGHTRTLTFELSPPVLYELGLVPALAWLAEQFEERHGVVIEVRDDGQPKIMDDKIQIVLFKAVSELLMNIMKHARAHKVVIFLKRAADTIQITVEDDGIGFDTSTMNSYNKTGGLGLFYTRERLRSINGSIEVTSAPGKGTKVTIVAPCCVDKLERT